VTLWMKIKIGLGIAAGMAAIFALILLRVFTAGKLAERIDNVIATRAEEIKVDKRVRDALKAGDDVRRDSQQSDADQLRVDDGYKRKPKRRDSDG